MQVRPLENVTFYIKHYILALPLAITASKNHSIIPSGEDHKEIHLAATKSYIFLVVTI